MDEMLKKIKEHEAYISKVSFFSHGHCVTWLLTHFAKGNAAMMANRIGLGSPHSLGGSVGNTKL